MAVTGLNHVSVHATDMAESLRFYTEVLGLERIPSPSFAFPVEWLRCGDLQLHLFARDAETEAPPYHHFGLTVDDFEEIYVRTRELGVHDPRPFYSHVYELPDGSVQMYLRDPAGNLVELDYPYADRLDRSVVTDLKRLDEVVPQTGDALRSTLFLTLRGGEASRV
jgi:catechol 2,3-dioxygenase-like lactoylglutathione lyase family enzyme